MKEPLANTALLNRDMVVKGWLPIDLARNAGVSHTTIRRFFGGDQNARILAKLAAALGHPVERYLMDGQVKASA